MLIDLTEHSTAFTDKGNMILSEAKRYFRDECALHELSERAQGIVIEVQHFMRSGNGQGLSLMACAILSDVCPSDDRNFEKLLEVLKKKTNKKKRR